MMPGARTSTHSAFQSLAEVLLMSITGCLLSALGKLSYCYPSSNRASLETGADPIIIRNMDDYLDKRWVESSSSRLLKDCEPKYTSASLPQAGFDK